MARRTGSADLPLHGGRVPHWLAQRRSGASESGTTVAVSPHRDTQSWHERSVAAGVRRVQEANLPCGRGLQTGKSRLKRTTAMDTD